MKSPFAQVRTLRSSFYSATRLSSPRGSAGLFDDPRRAGAIIAATTVLAAVGAIGATAVSDPRPGPAPVTVEAPVAAGTTASVRKVLVAPTEARDAAARQPAPGDRPDTGQAMASADGLAAAQLRMADASNAPAGQRDLMQLDSATTAVLREAGNQPVTVVQVAETEDQALALEAHMERVNPELFRSEGGGTAGSGTATTSQAADASPVKVASAVSSAPAPRSSANASANLQDATTTKWVNLHSGPDNSAKVVAIVPAKAHILAPPSCKMWCKVEYQGQQGYIYKDLVARPGKPANG